MRHVLEYTCNYLFYLFMTARDWGARMGRTTTAVTTPADRPTRIGWRLRRAVQWPLQRGLVAVADRFNLFVARGMHRTDCINARRFLEAPLWSVATDYVRNATLELICRDIQLHQVPGALAELGVYKGDFALLMHTNLPDRTIHLFDTFEGFDERDRAGDASNDYVAEFHDFSETSAAIVAGRFPERAHVILHPGWFPASAADIADQQFALVSVDADLYQPVRAGLEWFWHAWRMAAPSWCMTITMQLTKVQRRRYEISCRRRREPPVYQFRIGEAPR